MQAVHCYKRLTHRYNLGWMHLDKSAYVGSVKMTPPKVVQEGNGYDDGDVYVQYARIPGRADVAAVMQALRDTLTRSGCRHEYDCCGCASYSVSVERHSTRQLRIRTRVSYNY